MESYSLNSSKQADNLLGPKKDEAPFNTLSKDQVISGIKLIANATVSTSVSLLCVYTINMISLAFLTQLNDAKMIGGIGLGFVCSNCCAYILITSINQGINALAAQAFGAKRMGEVSTNYHRGLFLQMVVMAPVLVLLGFTEELLVAFGIDPETAEHAWVYIKYAYPSFIFYGIFDATKSFLFAQKIFRPILYIQLVAMFLHIFWGWLFIVQFEMGPAGAGMAKNVFELFNMIAILLYINRSESCRDTWVPFTAVDKKAVMEWEGIRKFMSFTLPIAAILFLDMACYEVFSILAGQFDSTQLAVHVAIANSATLFYSLPLGLSIAMMTYVSAAMGAGQTNAAKNYTYFGLIVAAIVSVGFIIFVFIMQDVWATLLTTDAESKALLLEILKIYLLIVFFDGLQVSLSGTLKGIGKQNAATIGLIVSYYLVALPLIYFFAFFLEMKVMGIWVGFLIGIIALFAVYLFILKTTNFAAQSRLLSQGYNKSKDNVEMLNI